MSELRRPFTVEDLWSLARVGAPVVAARLPYAIAEVSRARVEENATTTELWAFPLDASSPPRPLTNGGASSRHPAISPDGAHLAFVRAPHATSGEAKQPQLHVMRLDGGEARQVGDFPLGAADPKWLPDGRHVVVVAPVDRAAPTLAGTAARRKERAANKVSARVTEDVVYRFWDRWLTDGAVPHLFVVDVATGETRDLTPTSMRFWDFMEDQGQYDVSPDGREIAFAADTSAPPHARMRHGIFTVPIAGGEVRCLTEANAADDLRPRYAPDGSSIVFGSKQEWDFYGDRVRLQRFDRATSTTTPIAEAWDRSPAEWTFLDAHTLVGAVEDRGRARVFTVRVDDREGSSVRWLTEHGSAHGVSTRGEHAYFQHHAIDVPPAVARCTLAGGAIERLSRFDEPLLAGVHLAAFEERTIGGAGGDPVQIVIVRPPNFDPAKKWPLVHLVHGGPHGVFGDLWHFRWNPQVIASAGYVVAMVNFHGSSGFGNEFAKSVLGDWGGRAAEDVLRATDALLADGTIDETRMAITGGSYGGYMTAWLATQTDRFRCAIAHAAVFDLEAMYAGDAFQGYDREIGGAPWGGPEARAAIARFDPSAFTHGYRTPMLVVHGELDYRVPATQGLALYGVLKARGVDARLVYYPDENHWILKPQNSLHWYGEFLGWLRRHFA
jgi:dipeptidyl aminopeptidase/acylaminoacyl peptidase